MEPGFSLLCSQKPTTGSYIQTFESSPATTEQFRYEGFRCSDNLTKTLNALPVYPTSSTYPVHLIWHYVAETSWYKEQNNYAKYNTYTNPVNLTFWPQKNENVSS
jgi:hypothetical protein